MILPYNALPDGAMMPAIIILKCKLFFVIFFVMATALFATYVFAEATYPDKKFTIKNGIEVIRHSLNRFFNTYPNPLKTILFFVLRVVKVFLFFIFLPAIVLFYFVKDHLLKK